MIRNVSSDPKMATRTKNISRMCGRFVALGAALAFVIPAADAFAQSGYLSRDPNVSVDMSVLEELGHPATVVGPARPNNISIAPPLAFPPRSAPVSRLTGPLSLRRFGSSPAPRRQVSSAPPPPPPRTAPPPAVVQAPVPPVAAAPANVEVRAAKAVKADPPTAVPPAPVPPPVPAVATKEPAPDPAPTEEVKVATAPPPAAPTVSEAPPPKVQKQPEPPKPPAATASAPTLTPSPTGAVPAAPVQTASRPDVSAEQASFRVLFDEKSAKISDSARAPLQELSNTMKESESLRVQLLAYAGGTAETASQARRLSLSRALAVRSFLINAGVRSTRMDVRALGNKAEGGPTERVDAVLVER